MLKGKQLRSADIVISLLLIVLGIYIVSSSLGMPWDKRGWFTSPGLFPVILGCALIALSIFVLIFAFNEGGHHNFFNNLVLGIKKLPKNSVFKRVSLMWALISAYVFTLSTVFDYYIGGSLFLLVFMLFIHKYKGVKRTISEYLTIATISILVPLAIGQIFERLFLTPLP